MFRSLLSCLVCASVALSPLAQASAQGFIFRHKYPLQEAPPAAGEDIGLGNDIVAYYTAPVGYDFQKRIPVKTTEVETWVVEEGDIPSGIALDRSAGVHVGKPDVEQMLTHRLSGYDGANNRIAKAEINFNVREPKGIPVEVDFIAHVGQYSYNVIPTPPGVEVKRWDPWMVLPEGMPDGMGMRNEALEGIPTEVGEYTLLWQGYDHLNREVAFAYGDLTVTEGPRMEEIANQETNPAIGQAFRIQAVSHDVIATPVYRLILVDGVRPEGIKFNAETGLLEGLVEDFDWRATFKIKVTDTYDGTSDETEEFVLSTVAATFSMDDPQDIVALRNVNKSFGFNVQSTVPGLTWSLAPESAPLPPGMYIDADDRLGYIRGYPREIGEWPGIVLMASAPGFEKKAGPFKITVREQNVQTLIRRLEARAGQDIQTAGVTILRGRADPVVFSLADATAVPAGVTVAADTGVVKLPGGYPMPGSYRVGITLLNGDNQTYPLRQDIQVYPELSFSYGDGEFTRFQSSDRLLPVIDRNNIVGTATFTIDPALPEGLMIQPRTGVIQTVWGETIPKSAIDTQQYVVTMTDETGLPIPTAPFTIEIKDRPAMTAKPGTVEVERYVRYNQYTRVFPVAVDHAYPSGSARYSYTGTLPEGLEISEYGYFEGTTSADAKDYPGITVTVKDGDGPPVTFGPFTVTLKQAKPLQDLVGGESAETWVAGQKFDFQLPGPSNGKTPFKWVLTDAPAGLTVSKDGILSGTIPLEGDYTIRFDVSDDTARDAVGGTLALTIEEPFEFADVVAEEWDAYKNTRFEYPRGEVKVERGIKPFKWTVDPSTQFPSGWGFSNGWLWGTPNSSTGGFQLTVSMKDKAGVDKQFSTFVKFNPPKPLEVSYPQTVLSVGSTAGFPLAPKLNDKTVKIADWAPVTGLPSGVSFDTKTGEFKASPYPAESAAGIHTVNVVPRPVDPDVPLKLPSFPVTLKIGYAGEIGFPSKTFRHRVNADIAQKLSYTKAVEPVKFTEVSVGDGVSFDTATATFTATFAEPGTYTAGSVKIEENDDPAFDREKTTGFNFEIVPEVVLTVPETMTFGQFDEKSVGITEVLNVIGDGDETTPDVTYALAEGQTLPQGLTVNPVTGAVEGTPEVFGDFGPFSITASDAYGDSANSNGFTLKIAERKQLEVSYPSGFGHFRRYGVHTSAPQPVNGYGPYTWSIDRDPPAGITFDPLTGIFRASSDEIVEPQTFTVTVVDSKGGAKGTATAEVTVGIAERPQLTVKYDNPITFTRHVADLGKDPAKSGTVQRGGEIQFTVEPLNGGEALASCIGFDGTTGRFSTDPACTAEVPAGDYRVTVTDATWRDDGNAQGRTTADLRIGVQARPAITLDYPEYDKAEGTFGFQRHNVRTVVPTWNNPLGKDVTWSISPTPPAGIAFNDDGSITVDTADLIADAPYVVTVEDGFDGKATFPMVLGVGEREQLKYTLDPSVPQEIALNGEYELTLDVEHVIADGDDTTPDVIYTLLSGTLPTGIEFDTDGNGACGVAGTFCGTADVADHGKSFTVTVRAEDNFNGRVDGTFTFGIVEDATPMTVTYAEPGKARVGYAWSLAAPEVKFAVGNYSFSAPELAQYGLSINAKTGEITGTPNTTFDLVFDVTVTDKLGAARAVTVQVPVVSVPTPTVTIPNPVSILYNRDIPEDQQLTASGVEDPGVWSVDPAALPPGLTFDPLTGLFGGQAEDIGVYGPYTLTLDDALPGSFPTVFSFDIAMNDDPIELEELSVLTKVGFPFTTKVPAYDNHYRTVRFTGPELTAIGLSVDQTTGVVSGKIDEPMDVKPNLVIRDATIRTTSMPVNINVLPRLRLTAPETIFMTAFETVTPMPSVTPEFDVGALTWEDIDPQFLPVGVIYDTDGTKGCGKAATFCGAPLKEQTLGPFKLAATDTLANGLQDRAESNEITIKVRKGVFSMEFFPGALPDGTKRTEYSHDLVANGMFEYDGMDLSSIAFTMEADATAGEAVPPGLAVVNGVLVGTPLDEGTYTFDIVATYSTKPSVRGKFTVTTKRPDVEFDLAERTFAKIEKLTEFSFDFKTILTHTNVPVEDIVWSGPVALPNWEDDPRTLELPDMTFSPEGVLAGTPTGLGKFRFSITASYAHRKETYSDTVTYDIEVTGKQYLFKKVEVSEYMNTLFTCGINMVDEVMCWGDNTNRILGGVAVASTPEPTKGVLTAKVKELESGANQMCALTLDDRLMCWGRGYIGGSNVYESHVPAQVLANVEQFSIGDLYGCAVTKSKDTYCWGSNYSYKTGNPSDKTNTLYKVPALAGISKQVSAGQHHTCALTTAGDAMCWGDLTFGTSQGSKTWVPTLMASGISEVMTGETGYFFRRENGTVTANKSILPTLPAGVAYDIDNPARNRGSNSNPNCARVSDTAIHCGYSPIGKIGRDQIVFPAKIVDWSAGNSHLCAVTEGGATYCAGENSWGALGIPVSTVRTTTPSLVIGK